MINGLSPLRLSVHTQSGQSLGIVVDITVDPDTHTVLTYHVKPSRLMPDVVWSPLLIDRSQVIEITPSGMKVDDAVMRGAQRAPTALPSS